MARLEFAILQYLEDETGIKMVRTVLQRNEDDLILRLQRRVQEITGPDKRIEKAVEEAFRALIHEFKEETLRIV